MFRGEKSPFMENRLEHCALKLRYLTYIFYLCNRVTNWRATLKKIVFANERWSNASMLKSFLGFGRRDLAQERPEVNKILLDRFSDVTSCLISLSSTEQFDKLENDCEFDHYSGEKDAKCRGEISEHANFCVSNFLLVGVN